MSGAPGPQAQLELRSGSPLVERALAVLAAGPQPTAALAESALGLRGSPQAAAAAVFALLGADARFAVDAAGVWSLADPPQPALTPRLWQEDWVVVDVETTGGSPARGHRVIEVAAVRVSGGELRDTYATLVDPGRRVPSMITALTGITDRMLRGAPSFPEIAPRFAQVLEGRVFVAHNAGFDWGFVSAEMERALARRLVGRQLCTVRLGRKLLPQLRSRSLDALAEYFGLEIEARHRALDDAIATAKVLVRYLAMLEERGVEDWVGLEALLARRAPRRKRTRMPRSMDSA